MAVENLQTVNATTTKKGDEFYDLINRVEALNKTSISPVRSSANVISILKIRELSKTSQQDSLNQAALFPEKYASHYNSEAKTYFTPWKLIANISAKILSVDDHSVLLECLIDKENRIYEEREFNITLFKDYNIEIGNLFKVCLYRKDNKEMIEIINDARLISADDFPKINFFDEFKDLNLNTRID